MVVSFCLLRLTQWQLRVLGLDALHTLARPFTRLNCCLQKNSTVLGHRWSITLPRMRLMFRSLCQASGNLLSIELVDVSVLRSQAGIFSRSSVNSSSNTPEASSLPTHF
jgi:hypothetical protein